MITIESCYVEPQPLPEPPEQSACPEGSGLEICFSQAQAWRLAAWLAPLIDTHRAAEACEKKKEAP